MLLLNPKREKNNFQQILDRLLWVALAIILGTGPGLVRAEQTPDSKGGELIKVEGMEDAGRFKVLIQTKNPVDHKSFALTGPHRLVINLTPCHKGSSPTPELNLGPIQRLRSSQFNDDTVRIVLDLRRPVPYTITPQPGDPFTIMVNFPEEGGKKPALEATKPNKALTRGLKEETGREKKLAHSREEQKKPEGSRRGGDGGSRGGTDGLAEVERALQAKDFTGAIGLLKKIQEATPDKAAWKETGQPLLQQALSRQIGMVFEKGDHREVIRLYGLHQGSLKEGVDPGLLQNVGNSYKALGFYDPAVRYFQAAWQGGAQGSPTLVLDWAEALAGQGKAGEAAALVQNILDRPLGSGDLQGRAVRLMASCLYQQRLYLEALKTMEEAGRRYPRWDQDPENLYLQGLVCFEIPGSGPKALQAFKKFVTLGQNAARTALAYEKIGDLYFADKQYEEAWRAYYQATRVQPEDQGTFLAKKLTQCRLLAEERRRGSSAVDGNVEADPFWKKLYEHRSNQEKLDRKMSGLRLK